MSQFEPPILVIPVTLITTFAVAAALLINVFGFIIAAYHYSKVGVGPGVVPVLTMWGAGLSFSVLTALFVHIGFAATRLGNSVRPSEMHAYFGVAFVLILLISAFLIRYSGLLTYFAGCMLVGMVTAKGLGRLPDYVPRVTAESVTIAWPAVGFLGLLGLLWAYSVLAYPNLAGSLGGAAPQPVRVVLHEEFREAIASGSRVYQALVTGDAYYFEVQLPEGATKPKRIDLFLFRNLDPPATYVQVPRSAVKYVEYTDTFRRAPAVGDGDPTIPALAPPSATPEPKPSAPPNAAGAGPAANPMGHVEPK